MTTTEQRIAVTRGNLGQIASFIGGTALLLGLVGVLWQGGLTSYILALLIVGAVGLALWVLLSPREAYNFVTGRQARRGTVAVFSSLLLIGIVVMAYIYLDRAVLTFDMTTTGEFTLSRETREVLTEVDQPMQITGFYSPRLISQREIDDQFFRLYTDETDGLIRREYIDPLEQPALAELYRARDGEVFVSYLDESGEVDVNTISYVPLIGRQERDMTQAIARLMALGTFTVGFSQGNGELDPLENQDVRGLGTANLLMQENGFGTVPVNLAQLAEADEPVPPEVDTIVIARPQQRFTQAEIDLLDEYLAQGGNLYIMADAVFTEDAFLAEGTPFNSYLEENWGIYPLDAVVVEPTGVSGATPLDIISFQVFDSPITANINLDAQSRAQFRIARPLRVDMPPEGVINGSAILSSPDSWGETDLTALSQQDEYTFSDEADFVGPLTTVAWAENNETDAHIVLVGDSDFVTNAQINAPLGNAFLFADGIGWMTGFTEEVGFSPAAVGTGLPFIFENTATLDRIAFFTMVLMPGVVLAVGAAVWWRRSRR